MSHKPSRLERSLFAERVLALLDSIPRGRVATYGQLAREVGFPRHARHVGRVLAALSPGSPLPWHRVLNGAGRIAERARGELREQRRRLQREGIVFDLRGRVDLTRFQWRPFFPDAVPPKTPLTRRTGGVIP